jgi:hypothetical protein
VYGDTPPPAGNSEGEKEAAEAGER